MPAGLCRGRCDRLPECRRGGETQTDVARLFGQLGAFQLPRFDPLLCEQVPGGRHDGAGARRQGYFERSGISQRACAPSPRVERVCPPRFRFRGHFSSKPRTMPDWRFTVRSTLLRRQRRIPPRPDLRRASRMAGRELYSRQGTGAPTGDSGEEGAVANPALPAVQDHEIAIFKEVAQKYDFDGLLLDRARYDNIQSDFSDFSRGKFEAYIGKSWIVSRRISIRGRRTATAAGNASTALISSSGSSGARR
mgnify:CR=1 FL=1